MATLRFQCSWQQDTNLPTDVAVINPHFKATVLEGPIDEQTLANDLAAALDGWATMNTQLTVKVYNAEAPPPNYPLATAVRQSGLIGTSSHNRDVALVLSYWAQPKHPRRNGRIYVPCTVAGITPSGKNALTAAMQKAADLVPIFTGLGGVNIDWVVWSRVDHAAHSVTNWSVNNAWDTQRRRGGPPSDSLQGTTSEAGFP